MRLRVLAIALSFSLLGAACGSDSPSEDAGSSSTTSEASTTTSEASTASTSTSVSEDDDDGGAGSCPDAAPIPAGAADVTEGTIEFDGDNDNEFDTLVTYREGDTWWVSVEWAAGGSSRAVIDDAFMGAWALGGHDLDNDGNDEAFVSISGPASGVMVGIFYRDGCDIAPVLNEDAAAPFVFPITGSIGFFSGATCNSIGDISLLNGELLDADIGEYEVSEVPYNFNPVTGTVTSGFGDGGSVSFDDIWQYSRLDCGNLASSL